MQKIITLILTIATLLSLGACGGQGEKGVAPDGTEAPTVAPSVEDADMEGNGEEDSQPTEDGHDVNSEAGVDGDIGSDDQLNNIRNHVDIDSCPTMEGTLCVFITNNSDTVIDELTVQVNYKNTNEEIIDLDSDGHDVILPGHTVVSELDAPDEYADYEIEYDIEVGVHPKYRNHADQCDVSSNRGDNCVIVQVTNNSDVEIEEIEYIVVFYQGDVISSVSNAEDVYDVSPGDTITEKVLTGKDEYDRFEVYLNQAHTFR